VEVLARQRGIFRTSDCGRWDNLRPYWEYKNIANFSRSNYLYALTSDGTPKWKLATSNMVNPSAAIASDGTIYFACAGDKNIYAVAPDGRIKWKFATGEYWVVKSLAIGADGTVYAGSSDDKLNAVAPDGTLKWKFTIGTSSQDAPGDPMIGADGTVYFSSLRALYSIHPDGKQNLVSSFGYVEGATPVIGVNGIIYLNVTELLGFTHGWHGMNAGPRHASHDAAITRASLYAIGAASRSPGATGTSTPGR
jgi:outer membrane protein assembly factor BamB